MTVSQTMMHVGLAVVKLGVELYKLAAILAAIAVSVSPSYEATTCQGCQKEMFFLS
jgi:hypothetical protein